MQAGKETSVMQRVVIDTNVLISSVIAPGSKPAEIMSLCFLERIQVIYAVKILDEYKRVLSYERLNIEDQTQNAILDAIEEIGILVNLVTESDIPMPDETDRIFYDTARETTQSLSPAIKSISLTSRL
jgi:putative PIN family toxin of toxin-antitoxin system